MLNYLTSDEVIRAPFLIDEILPRFVSTLLNILSRLVGTKSLELKVYTCRLQRRFFNKTCLCFAVL